MAYATTDHIKNVHAAAFIKNLRLQYCGYSLVYTSRYMTQLAKICKYQCGYENDFVRDESSNHPSKMVYVIYVSDVRKEFNSPKAAGIFMEQKINDLYELCI